MFGSRLNKTRKSKGYTAQTMADFLSVSLRTYRHYESETSYPSLDTLVKIANILDVSTDFLLCRDEWMISHGVSFDEYL